MKRRLLAVVFIMTSLYVYSQRLSTVGILPFEPTGSGVGPAEAAEATRMIIAELSSWGTMTVLSGAEAGNGEYLVRGQVSRQNNQIVLSAATLEGRTGRLLNNSKEQASSLEAISAESFCEQITENVPYPNYLLGTWQSTINMIDGPVICIMEFRSDRTVQVRQYDTWEHNGTNSLKYQAIGKGTYTYAGYRQRTVVIGGRELQVDATIGVNLTLEDALPKYTSVGRNGIRALFDDSKTNLELLSAGLPCGDNFSGPSVYPGETVAYTKFSKIQ